MLRKVEKGMDVIWLDPEKSARDLSRVYQVADIKGDVILIADKHSEAEVFENELEKPGDIDMITSVIDECFSWMEQRELESFKKLIIDDVLKDIYESADANFSGSDVRIALARIMFNYAHAD